MTTTPIDRSQCGAPRHGTWAAANKARCRCPDALEALRRYRKHQTHGRLPPGIIDATGTIRRLQALAAIGWSGPELGARLGYRPSNAAQRVADLRNPRSGRVFATSARAVAALYERLSGTPGPSDKTRARAHAAGWAPPLLWEDADIDNPDAQPLPDDQPRGRGRSARIDLADIDHLQQQGYQLHAIAARLGVNTASIRRAKQRAAAAARRAAENAA